MGKDPEKLRPTSTARTFSTHSFYLHNQPHPVLPKQKGPSRSPDPLVNHASTYCGGVVGGTEIGFGGSGGFGAVNPGITGVCGVTPVAAL
jgi:hypothetical protein